MVSPYTYSQCLRLIHKGQWIYKYYSLKSRPQLEQAYFISKAVSPFIHTRLPILHQKKPYQRILSCVVQTLPWLRQDLIISNYLDDPFFLNWLAQTTEIIQTYPWPKQLIQPKVFQLPNSLQLSSSFQLPKKFQFPRAFQLSKAVPSPSTKANSTVVDTNKAFIFLNDDPSLLHSWTPQFNNFPTLLHSWAPLLNEAQTIYYSAFAQLVKHPLWTLSHGDIRPDNIVYSSKKYCLIDWDLAGTYHMGVELFGICLNFSSLYLDNIANPIHSDSNLMQPYSNPTHRDSNSMHLDSNSMHLNSKLLNLDSSNKKDHSTLSFNKEKAFENLYSALFLNRKKPIIITRCMIQASLGSWLAWFYYLLDPNYPHPVSETELIDTIKAIHFILMYDFKKFFS